jgi:hypothetical protein
MSASEPTDRLSVCLRITRIIVAALALGVVGFAVIAVVQREQNPAPLPPQPVLTYLGLGFGGVMIVLQAVVPGLMTNQLRRKIASGTWPLRSPARPEVPPDDAGKLCLLFQSRTITGAAFVEGAAFFLLVAYLIEGQLIALGGAAVMLVLLLVRFPTRLGLESWLGEQQERLNQERQAI